MPKRFRGSKRRVRELEQRHGGINLWLLLLGFLLLEALAFMPWLLLEIGLDAR